jgi:hypothetical protein
VAQMLLEHGAMMSMLAKAPSTVFPVANTVSSGAAADAPGATTNPMNASPNTTSSGRNDLRRRNLDI